MFLGIIIGTFYSGYLLVDTHLILGGRHHELSLDNHILGATILYVDIIQLFLEILRIVGKKKEE